MSRPEGAFRPEVLAPAGDAESMRAAVRAGADAVYFGLSSFSARARATNFPLETLRDTMRTLHESGVRGYVALNTLVFDDELPALESAIRGCAAAGVDALIVQDIGVARLVREIAPNMPMHASTQMTCTDAGSVEFARSIGASRVILARELSLDDIADIRHATDMELEVFVHGALCIAYSGQCLTSEAIGGRSANRGACAQACRLPYRLVVDGEVRADEERAFLLSPEDLEASELVPRLIELGVRSLKIEGRLKGPDYVAATTHLYRSALDLLETDSPSDEVPAALCAARTVALQTYSRGSGPGFLRGVDHQRLVEGLGCDHRGLAVGVGLGTRRVRGKMAIGLRLERPLARGDGILVEGGFGGEGELGGRVWSIAVGGVDVHGASPGDEAWVWLGPDRPVADLPLGRRVFKTSDPNASKEIAAAVGRERSRIGLAVRVTGNIGEAPIFEAVAAGGARARVEGDAVLALAHSAPLTAAAAREKIGRLGGSPFFVESFAWEVDPRAIVPISSFNRARRRLVEALLAEREPSWETRPVSHEALAKSLPLPKECRLPGGLFVLCRTLEQATAALDAGASGVYLDFLELTGTGNALRELKERGAVHVGVAPPRIRKPGEEKIDRYLQSLAPDSVLVRGFGALHQPALGSAPRIADFSLNVTNQLTAAIVLSKGVEVFTPSFDLDSVQLAQLLDGPLAKFAEVVVHHPMPLFHMEHCVIAALLSNGGDHKTCGRPCDRHLVSLRDRAGMDHPVEADVCCRNTVFHAAPQSAATLVPRLMAVGVTRFRIELVRESAADVGRVIGAYRQLLEGAEAPDEIWRSLKAVSGYGVVRGSLRILPS